MANQKKRIQPKRLLPFFERLEQIVGTSLFSRIKYDFFARPTTFRVNTLLATRQDIMQELQQKGFKYLQVVWYKDAFILKNKNVRALKELDMYKEGRIYLQSLASMIPPIVLEPKPGSKVLDLTAAPGSKTSQIAAYMQKKGELVANDIDEIRCERLKHNLHHLGVVDKNNSSEWTVRVKQTSGQELSKEYTSYFDYILLDAPCSAEARFDFSKPSSYAYWSEKKIKQMAYTQRGLLLSVWDALRPGGTLVYSTCTMAPEENEGQISRLLERNNDAEVQNIDISVKKIPPVSKWRQKIYHSSVKNTLRVRPTEYMEGFYIAKVKKRV